MPTVFDISTLTSDDGLIVQGGFGGGPLGDQAGFSVSSAGDVNGDGFEDFIVGAINGDEGGSNSGTAYVIFGRARGLGLLDLTALAPTDGFMIQGDAANDLLGYSVASGDVNGDGFDDLIVGARDNDAGGSNAGAVYVIFGKASGFATIDLGSLAATDGFVIQGDNAGDQAGFDVSSAGDINDDGFDDIIIGAPLGDDGGAEAGEAYVIFGKANPVDLDLSLLAATDGFIIQGDDLGDNAGRSVSSAGDVNGDGFDDIIVGAHLGDDVAMGQGAAYVIFGKASGFANIDLTGLAATDGFIIQGADPNDNAGRAVSSAGDINGDGFDDLLVGAPNAELGFSGSGETYVIFGKASGFTTIDVATLNGTDGFTIRGFATGDSSGYSVAAAGDVNGDGLADIIIGAPFQDDGGTFAGLSYVVYGKTSGFGTLSLNGITPEIGFLIQGDELDDRSGSNVSGAGDVDGDGFDDVIVGARFGGGGGDNAGEAYIVYGFGTSDFPLLFELREDVSPASGLTIIGDTPGDAAGWSVSSAGDVNGDGLDDFVVGARFGDDGGTNAGEAYVIFGRTDGIGTIDLSGLGGGDGFIVKGELNTDQASFSVATAGDVNGDGFDDLMIGTPYDDDGGASAGAAYVIFGKASGFSNIDLFVLTVDKGFKIQGDAAGDQAGWSVSSAGDVNGDGLDDMIVGARLGDDGGVDAGEAYVLFGKASGFTLTVDLTGLAARPADGFIIQGDLASDNAGHSVASAGDVNNDGFDDLIVGAPLGDDGGASAGEAYVIFGKASAFATIDLTGLSATDGFIITGDTGDKAGTSVDSAGDFNGDGFGDLIIGAPTGNGNVGEAYVVFGKASGFGTVDLAALAATDGFLIQGGSINDLAGEGVSSARDVDGDGFDDILVGAPRNDEGGGNSGQAYLIFGKASGFATIDVDALTAADGFVIQGAGGGDNAGRNPSSAGDVDGDGFDDIIVGAHYGDLGGADSGEAYVIFGRKPTTAVIRTGAGGDQTIRGGDFGDTLSGVGGADRLVGGDGADVLIGGLGIDTTEGGLGDDNHNVESAGDVVVEAVGEGNDIVVAAISYVLPGTAEVERMVAIDAAATTALNLFGNGFANNIQGNAGVNVLLGQAGDDILVGFAGADNLNGGTGNDVFLGGLGDDVFILDSASDLVIENAGEGRDTIFTPVNYNLRDIEQVESLVPLDQASTAALNLSGNSLANTVYGNAGVNVLIGNAGDDILLGQGGDDTLDGGTGNDNLNGGLGNDIYYIDSVSDVIVEVDGQGTNDRVFTSATYILRETEYVEQLVSSVQSATNAMNLTGNSRINTLQGNNGNNIMDGKGGNDALLGFAGADTFVFSTALNALTNTDTIVGYTVADDIILLGGAAGQPFIALPAGTLAASAFVIGSDATTAAHRIVYNSATGGLFYDADGVGGALKVQFAILSPGLAMTNAEFIVADPLAYAAGGGAPGAAPAEPKSAGGEDTFGLAARLFGGDADLQLPVAMHRWTNLEPLFADAVAFA